MPLIKQTIKLDLAHRTDPALDNYATDVHDGLDFNVLFQNPVIPLNFFKGYINAFHNSIVACGTVHNRGPHSAFVAKDAARGVLSTAMTQQANWCMSVRPYHGPAFETGGWELKDEGTPQDVLTPPQNARQVHADNLLPGQAKVDCTPLPGASSYIAVGFAPASTVAIEVESQSTNMIIPGLTYGVVYTFRIYGFNTKGRGAPSDIFEVRCAM